MALKYTKKYDVMKRGQPSVGDNNGIILKGAAAEEVYAFLRVQKTPYMLMVGESNQNGNGLRWLVSGDEWLKDNVGQFFVRSSPTSKSSCPELRYCVKWSRGNVRELWNATEDEVTEFLKTRVAPQAYIVSVLLYGVNGVDKEHCSGDVWLEDRKAVEDINKTEPIPQPKANILIETTKSPSGRTLLKMTFGSLGIRSAVRKVYETSIYGEYSTIDLKDYLLVSEMFEVQDITNHIQYIADETAKGKS